MKLYIGKKDEIRIPLDDYYVDDDILGILYECFLTLFKERSIKELRLSTRAENMCMRNGLLTVGNVMDVKDTMRLSWCGLSTMKEIYECLVALGFQIEAWNPRNYYRDYNRGRRKI